MLDVGFQEVFLIAVVGLLVLGPQRLPEALRTMGLWMGRLRRSFNSVKGEIEREIGMDDIRRQLHNEAVMDEMKRIEQNVRDGVDGARNTIHGGVAEASENDPEPEEPITRKLPTTSGGLGSSSEPTDSATDEPTTPSREQAARDGAA